MPAEPFSWYMIFVMTSPHQGLPHCEISQGTLSCFWLRRTQKGDLIPDILNNVITSWLTVPTAKKWCPISLMNVSQINDKNK